MNILFEFELKCTLKKTVQNKNINEVLNAHIYLKLTKDFNSIKKRWENFTTKDFYTLADIESICYSSEDQDTQYFIFDKNISQKQNINENTYRIIVLTSSTYENSFNYVLNEIKKKFAIFNIEILKDLNVKLYLFDSHNKDLLAKDLSYSKFLLVFENKKFNSEDNFSFWLGLFIAITSVIFNIDESSNSYFIWGISLMILSTYKYLFDKYNKNIVYKLKFDQLFLTANVISNKYEEKYKNETLTVPTVKEDK